MTEPLTTVLANCHQVGITASGGVYAQLQRSIWVSRSYSILFRRGRTLVPTLSRLRGRRRLRKRFAACRSRRKITRQTAAPSAARFATGHAPQRRRGSIAARSRWKASFDPAPDRRRREQRQAASTRVLEPVISRIIPVHAGNSVRITLAGRSRYRRCAGLRQDRWRIRRHVCSAGRSGRPLRQGGQRREAWF